MRTKEQNAARLRGYRKAYPLKARDTFLKSRFGLSLTDYQILLQKQEGKCTICGKGETTIYRGRVKALAVDHCHTTQVVRGLLCQHCNLILGHCNDDPAILRRAAAYLDLYRSAGKRSLADEAISTIESAEINY